MTSRIDRHVVSFALAAIFISSCADQSPPPIAVSPNQTYLDIIGGTESQLASGVSMGLIYVHPIQKRTCKTMQVRLSRKMYNGIEHSWEPEQLIELEHLVKAPPDKRQIGAYPVFFDMAADSSYRIDALSCQAYDKTITTQYQTFAEFEAAPGQLSYIGDFTQNRLAESVDIYTSVQDISSARKRIGNDSEELLSFISLAEVKPFSFENHDGTQVSAQDIIDNKALSGDYFTLSQTLKTQAENALLPFLGYLPDFTFPGNGQDATQNIKRTLNSGFDLALLRLDLQADFHDILKAGKSYEVAREYIRLRLYWVNSERQREESGSTYPGASNLISRSKKLDYDYYQSNLSKHGLKGLIDKQVSEERQNARKAWKAELDRLPYVLNTQFSFRQDTIKRDRVQRVMNDYIPAKYASLKLELSHLGEAQDLAPTEMRRLRRLIESAQKEEQTILNELIQGFLRVDLSENKVYHKAREDFDRRWQEIFEVLQIA